jgi:hypothetical protein
LVKKVIPAEVERSNKMQENHFLEISKIIDFGLACADRELEKQVKLRS